MSNTNYIEELKKLSPEQLAALEQSLPEDLMKQAQAEVDRELLAESLYEYGRLQCEREFATYMGEGDLSKVASAEEIKSHEETEQAVKENIETLFSDLGFEDAEDEAELLKEAQAAAGFIFAGYTDALEKIADNDPAKAKSFMERSMDSLKEKGSKAKAKAHELYEAGKAKGKAALESAKTHGAKAMDAIKAHGQKHGKLYAAGAAGLAAGALAKHMYDKKKKPKKMEKKASDMTVLELHEELTKIAEVDQGLEKLASFADAKGAAARKFFE